jgi:hypothetical protein
MRRRLAGLLLVLHVAVLHGLPALHLAWHRDDHVHALGGLRWLRPPPPHVHAPGEQHPADDQESPAPDESRHAPPHHLRAAANAPTSPLALHLAAGPAHAQSVLLAALPPVFRAPSAHSPALTQPWLSRRCRPFWGQQRARAPPSAV